MDAALVVSAALLGLAGTPHCAAMCAAPCAAATAAQGPAGVWGFQLARVASYAAAGAVAASSVATLAAWAQVAPALRPLWTLLHVAALALGLWLLWQGRQPAWMGALGRRAAPSVSVQPLVLKPAGAAPGSGPWGAGPLAAGTAGNGRAEAATRPARPWAAVSAGLLWAAWPCGLLQSALLVSALTSGAAAGAAAMGLFAVASSAGLVLGPWAWRRWLQGPGAARRERALARVGGAMLAAGSAWGLSHDLWHRVAVWCGLA